MYFLRELITVFQFQLGIRDVEFVGMEVHIGSCL